MVQTLEDGEAAGDQQYEQSYAGDRQGFARRRGRQLGRTLNAGMLMLGVLLDRLDLLVALGLRNVPRMLRIAGLGLLQFALFTHA
jgi:hypothetical protein